MRGTGTCGERADDFSLSQIMSLRRTRFQSRIVQQKILLLRFLQLDLNLAAMPAVEKVDCQTGYQPDQ